MKSKLFALVLIASALCAGAQSYSVLNLTGGAANPACTVLPQSATNVGVWIDISLQKDVAISLAFAGDAAGTANATAWFVPSTDGTTNTTDNTKGFPLIAPATAATQVTVTTNLYAQLIAGYPWLWLKYISNASATANFTNVTVKVGVKRSAR